MSEAAVLTFFWTLAGLAILLAILGVLCSFPVVLRAICRWIAKKQSVNGVMALAHSRRFLVAALLLSVSALALFVAVISAHPEPIAGNITAQITETGEIIGAIEVTSGFSVGKTLLTILSAVFLGVFITILTQQFSSMPQREYDYLRQTLLSKINRLICGNNQTVSNQISHLPLRFDPQKSGQDIWRVLACMDRHLAP